MFLEFIGVEGIKHADPSIDCAVKNGGGFSLIQTTSLYGGNNFAYITGDNRF